VIKCDYDFHTGYRPIESRVSDPKSSQLSEKMPSAQEEPYDS